MATLKKTMFVRGDDFLHVVEMRHSTSHRLATKKLVHVPNWHAETRMGRNSGAGIYGCFFRGALFYIGIFCGNGAQQNGSVARERWRKHVAGMTLRGLDVTLCKTALETIASEGAQTELASAIRAADHSAMSRDKGLNATINKYRFAERYWDSFRGLDCAMMADFRFFYVRLASDDALGPKANMKRHLELVENKIVRLLKPPCNNQSGPNDGQARVGLRCAVRIARAMLEQHVEAVVDGRLPLVMPAKPSHRRAKAITPTKRPRLASDLSQAA